MTAIDSILARWWDRHSCLSAEVQAWRPVPTSLRPGKILWEEAFEALRKRFDDVVVDDEHGDQHEEGEAYLGDALFHAAIQVAADGAFDQQQQDQPAVEHRDGEQVEDAEVQADGGHQADQVSEALARRGSREARNADGAFERARREVARA